MKEYFLILFWKGYKVEVKKVLDKKLLYLGKKMKEMTFILRRTITKVIELNCGSKARAKMSSAFKSPPFLSIFGRTKFGGPQRNEIPNHSSHLIWASLFLGIYPSTFPLSATRLVKFTRISEPEKSNL